MFSFLLHNGLSFIRKKKAPVGFTGAGIKKKMLYLKVKAKERMLAYKSVDWV